MVDQAISVSEDIDQSRRRFLTSATVATGAVGAAFAAVPFVKSWLPSERARALGAPSEVDVSKLEPGQMVIVTWRKQAVYVVHRTPQMLETLPANNPALKDPDSSASIQPPYADNIVRSLKPEYLVLIGICTHLGCLPKQHFERGDAALGTDWPGGFFCPCHGSKFDMSGRVFEGSPANANLVVPPYSFPDDATLLIGADADAATGVA